MSLMLFNRSERLLLTIRAVWAYVTGISTPLWFAGKVPIYHIEDIHNTNSRKICVFLRLGFTIFLPIKTPFSQDEDYFPCLQKCLRISSLICRISSSVSASTRLSLVRWCIMPAPKPSPSTFTEVRILSLKICSKYFERFLRNTAFQGFFPKWIVPGSQ